MVSMKVDMQLSKGKGPIASYAGVSVKSRFVFHNTGAPVTASMGFPEYRQGDATGFQQLRCKVDGRRVSVKRILGQRSARADTYWWVKNVRFGSNKTRVVEYSYKCSLEADGSGYRHAAYIMETGRSWQGTIGEAIITVDISAVRDHQTIIAFPFDHSRSEHAIVWHYLDFEPKKSINVGFWWGYANFVVNGEFDPHRYMHKCDRATAPRIENGMLWVPAYVLMRILDIHRLSSYDRKTYEMDAGGRHVSVTIGSTSAILDGETVILPAAPVLRRRDPHNEPVLMLPFAAIARAIGAKVRYSSSDHRTYVRLPTPGTTAGAPLTSSPAAVADDSKPPLLLETGQAWVFPGIEMDAAIVCSAGRKGELYLWMKDQDRYPVGVRVSFTHVALKGTACVDGMSWSPNGAHLAFYEDLNGEKRARLVSCRRGQRVVAHAIARGKVFDMCWSPDSRYLAFVERNESGDRLRCTPKDEDMDAVSEELWAKAQVFDLIAPPKRSLHAVQWSPDSHSLLGIAHDEHSVTGKWEPVSSASLFVSRPGARSAKIIWQDEKHQNFLPDARWALGGDAVVFALLNQSPAYDIPVSLHLMDADGGNLRSLWTGDFASFEVSPNGKYVLLWILDEGWGDAPEPTRMAAVNLMNGNTRIYEKDTVALESGCVTSGVHTDGYRRQDIEWSEDDRSVALLVYSARDWSDWRRVTLELPQ